MKKKRSLTLLEIMIVIVLIGIIGSVIGVNMRGSLEKGRIFKSQQARQQIEDILNLEVAKGAPIGRVIADPEFYLEDSGLIKDGAKYMKDGWNVRFNIEELDGRVVITSDKLTAHEVQEEKSFEEVQNGVDKKKKK